MQGQGECSQKMLTQAASAGSRDCNEREIQCDGLNGEARAIPILAQAGHCPRARSGRL